MSICMGVGATAAVSPGMAGTGDSVMRGAAVHSGGNPVGRFSVWVSMGRQEYNMAAVMISAIERKCVCIVPEPGVSLLILNFFS